MDIQRSSHSSDDYLAALEDSSFYIIPNPGTLRIIGETREEYIQRQTSNDLGLVSPSRAVQTILPSPTGRIYELLTLVHESDALLVLTQSGHGPGLAAYFQKRIFFNDQVTIQDVSQSWAQIEIHGPAGGRLLDMLGAGPLNEFNEVAVGSWNGAGFRVVALDGFSSELRYLLVCAAKDLELLISEFSDTPQMTTQTREILRVERGAAGDPEFKGEYTPFEVGLGKLVSSEKGCYTGQEVLARQVTYDKVVRNLVRVSAGDPVLPGSKLAIDGKPVGEITSAAHSPKQGHLALAVVRKPYDQPGTSLSVDTDNGATTAEITQKLTKI